MSKQGQRERRALGGWEFSANQRDRETERQRDRETDREIERQRARETDRETERQRERQTAK